MTGRIVFDIETNGLMPGVSKVWCLGTKDIDTGSARLYGPEEIEEGLAHLYEADELIAHNGISYDLKVLQKLYQWGPRPGCNISDTLVMARVIHSNIKVSDGARVEAGTLEGSSFGRHTLKAWGQRLGNYKGDYDGGWETYSDAMGTYCMQDLEVTEALYSFLKPSEQPQAPFVSSSE